MLRACSEIPVLGPTERAVDTMGRYPLMNINARKIYFILNLLE